MLNDLLLNFYERDIRKLIDEVNLFKKEDNLWKTYGAIKNSCGNLVLHIVGGSNFLIGTRLGHTGYVRNRDEEFSKKGTPRKELVEGLERLIPMIQKALGTLTQEKMEEEYPSFFDKPHVTNAYVLTALLAHLNYHLGQVNYLRRMLEPEPDSL